MAKAVRRGSKVKMSRLNNRISGRKLSTILAIVVLSTLYGCGVKWWYGQMDYLIRFRMDQYFDTTTQQADFISAEFKKHLLWHRYEGIPIHLDFLVATQKHLADGITRPEISWFLNQYREQMRLLVDRLLTDSVQFLTLLDTKQIDYFSEWQKEDNEKYAERLKMSREERLELRAEKTIESLEDWLGSLSDSQEAEITKLSLQLPDSFESWYQQKVQRQQQFISVLRKNNGKEEIREALYRFLLPTDKNSSNGLSEPVIEMVLAIDRLATPAQRQHLSDKIQEWVDDLSEINRFKDS